MSLAMVASTLSQGWSLEAESRVKPYSKEVYHARTYPFYLPR